MTDSRINQIRALLPKAMTRDWVRIGSRLVRLLRDQHHPTRHEALLQRLLEEATGSVELREQRTRQVPGLSYPAELPIIARHTEIVSAIKANQVLIIAGETGSGKTTQIPKMCLEAGLGLEAMIGCTQPRRVAALSISRRVAEELNVEWGRQIGCKIRFDDRSSRDTYIKFMTDGVLLAETQNDPLLSSYNALIIDEAHERSLNIDFLLGYLKGLLTRRPELKLIVTSATIDTKSFSQAFNDAPIIEVSGRIYPVEVVYAPLDEAREEAGELSYVDAAVMQTERIVGQGIAGDVLIFMPAERDIREASDALRARFEAGAEIVPLFGRLTAAEQQRVFAPSARRKIVVATNIAETSLTIPGIRFVIDSGLARVSRYNPRSRTKRLPIEAISQSSANQRKGRSGRLENGICIRLYSEQDFAARPPFSQPEIQRANLAEVILRMKGFQLGEIESFPFINPPTPAAIQGGYKLLEELRALDEKRELTELGRDLSRLPIDPTLGRMLLQAHHERATRELLIIASGLSIQDPRERPLDQKDAAAAAHKQFVDPSSDFLTLLNIWNGVHEKWESLGSQNQRRKFCRANFLSYLRMREWQDLHAQLYDVLDEIRDVHLNESNAAYDAVHRSILAGLLGHVARRSERNRYQGVGNRELQLFPGSVLYSRTAKPKRSKDRAAAPQTQSEASRQPEWIMAGEQVETSQLFARTVAGIDPEWILELAPHLCKTDYRNPRWSVRDRRVVADQIVTFYGLEVRRRTIAYGQVAPKEATAIFIRAALVEEDLVPEPERSGREPNERELSSHELLALARPPNPRTAVPYAFIEHNRRVRQKIEVLQTRLRRHEIGDPDEALFDFYSKRLENVSSFDELNKALREAAGQNFLCATEQDLAGDEDLDYDRSAFPDSVQLAGHSVPLSYAYRPGEEQDGVTVKLDLSLASAVDAAALEWAVPGLREGQVEEMLRALPKSLRRQLMPLQPKAVEIARELRPSGPSLKSDLAAFIRCRYGIEVPVSAWTAEAVPNHLRPRIEIVVNGQEPLVAGRDLDQLRRQLESAKIQPQKPAADWSRAAAKWERFGLTTWNFGDVPERIPLDESNPNAGYVFPGLELEDGQVNLRLFAAEVLARKASERGVRRLMTLQMQKDLAWMQKDLRALSRFQPLVAGWITEDEFQAAAMAHLESYLFSSSVPGLQESQFAAAVERARQRIPGLVPRLLELIEPVLKLRSDILARLQPKSAATPARHVLTAFDQLSIQAPAVAAPARPFAVTELESLLPKNFLSVTPFERLPQLPRYLKALLVRCERAALNPLKDRERAAQVASYVVKLRLLRQQSEKDPAILERADVFRWMIEEFKVSLFAQELGTAFPISARRLDDFLLSFV